MVIVKLLSVLTYFIAFSAMAGDLVGPKSYSAIRDISIHLVEVCPPADCAIVVVGQSPMGLSAFLKNVYSDYVYNLPYSRATQTRSLVAQSPRLKSVCESHFESYLEQPIKQGKKLLFVDYVVNGSFGDALYMLDDFLKTKHPSTAYDFRALTTPMSLISRNEWLPNDKVINLNNFDFEFERLLRMKHFDYLSEYGGWTPTDYKADQKAPSGEAFQRLKRDLYEDMKHDPKVLIFFGALPQPCSKYLETHVF